MNLGQALGILHLRIHDLEEGRPVQPADDSPRADPDVVQRLQDEIAALRTNETRALLRVAEERKLRVLAENKLTSALERIGKLEAKPAAIRGDDGALQAVNEDLRTQIRGKDAQVAELQRVVGNKDAYIAALTREIDHLKARPPEVIEKPVPAECPVCKAIKLMVLGVEPVPASHLHRTVVVHATSLRSRMQEALERADAPLTAEEIGHVADISANKVETNIWHLVREGKVTRLGSPGGHGRKAGRYRYWLASRPLPAGSEA